MRILMKRKRAVAGILWLLLLWPACDRPEQIEPLPRVVQGDVELSASVDRATVTPGDIITFTLRASHEPGISLELPELAEKFSDFKVVKSGGSGPSRKGDRIIVERWYKLQPDSPGSYVIDSIEVPCRLADGREQAARTPKIFLEVESLLAQQEDTSDIRDIKPPVSIGPSFRRPLLFLAGLAAAALAIVLLWKAVQRLRTKIRTDRLAPRPAHEEALEALERLLRQGLTERGRAREFCFGISEIFRRYMEARFGIPAIDLTTEEILPRFEHNGIMQNALKPLVREFLTHTDLVKFARRQPTDAEIHEIIETARTFITATIPETGEAIETASARGGEAT